MRPTSRADASTTRTPPEERPSYTVAPDLDSRGRIGPSVAEEPLAAAEAPSGAVEPPAAAEPAADDGRSDEDTVPPTPPRSGTVVIDAPRGTARALARSSRRMAPVDTAPSQPDRSGLGRLDDVVVPRLQRGARAGAHVATAPLRGVTHAEDAVAGPVARWGVRNRRVLTLVIVALAVAGSSIHFERYPRIQQAEADRRAAAAEQSVTEPGAAPQPSDALAGGSQVVGPAVGADVDDYIDQRHATLRDVAADEVRVAIVSFTEYVNAAEALGGVPEGAGIHAAQLRIPAQGEQPFQTEVVGNDLLGSVDRALSAPMAELAEEESSLEQLIPTVNDPAFRAEYERRLEELRAIRNLVNTGSGTVFALIIEAPGGALQELLERDSVRLVDVAPGETDPSRSGFFGLLPEDADTVSRGVEA